MIDPELESAKHRVRQQRHRARNVAAGMRCDGKPRTAVPQVKKPRLSRGQGLRERPDGELDRIAAEWLCRMDAR